MYPILLQPNLNNEHIIGFNKLLSIIEQYSDEEIKELESGYMNNQYKFKISELFQYLNNDFIHNIKEYNNDDYISLNIYKINDYIIVLDKTLDYYNQIKELILLLENTNENLTKNLKIIVSLNGKLISNINSNNIALVLPRYQLIILTPEAFENNISKHCLFHELAHLVSDNGESLLGSNNWNKIQLKDLYYIKSLLKEYYINDNKINFKSYKQNRENKKEISLILGNLFYISKYALSTNSTREDWAESLAFYLTNKTFNIKIKNQEIEFLFQDLFPYRNKYIKEFVDN